MARTNARTQDADHEKSIGQNDGGKIIGLSSSASFCPHHFARLLEGGCLARQIESILRAI